MKYPVSRIPLRAVLITLAPLLWLLISAPTTSTLYAEVIVTTPPDPIHLPCYLYGFAPLDVDGDGSTDFYFRLTPSLELALEPATSGRIIVITYYPDWPGPDYPDSGPTPQQDGFPGRVAPLASGVEIGPTLVDGLQWARDSRLSDCGFDPELGFRCCGEFLRLGAYIGIQFPTATGAHYGWIRFDHFGGSPSGSILQWAFESRPYRPIKTPHKPVVVPMAPPKLARPGYLRLNWRTKPCMTYQVQAKPRMDALTWTNLTFLIPATTHNTMLDLPITAPAQFFRVIQLETQTPVFGDGCPVCDFLLLLL